MVAAVRDANLRLRAENERLRAENAELKAQLAEQAAKIARLERLISRNSGNSSMPPSADDLPGKKPPQRKARGGGKRKPGKQPGAPGAYLAWSDHPDATQDVFPDGTCACGQDLASAADLGVKYSHQVTDLPDARARTTQYDRHEVACRCGRTHVADAPPEPAGAPGTVTYGLNFQAWCVFLMVIHHVPVERCADILESMSGTRPSDGWVHALLARAATAAAAANTAIRALIILARVVCGDETPLRAGPGPKRNKKYLQVACTNLLTYYFLGERTLPSFKDFIYSDLHGAVIVHDRYVNYDHFDGVSHQLCTAHILRDIEDAAQVYPHAHWPAQIARELRALIHAANTARGQGLDRVPDDMTAEHLKLFRNAVNVGLSQVSRVPGVKAKQRPGRLLLECLKNREADVLRFLTDTAIPPTSNQAERDLRPAKTQQKISGRLRSEKTTRDRYAIRGYASTAAKHGVAVFTAIYAALAGNPWIPPVPDCA
ncbi:MAG TPA: IS66 family transposase [Streptosporangiaceae bacterium]|nr:IS66 family transposase [Streptosporangiaceae bacterium]